MRRATAHLLHGFIGAGKTHFARELEQNVGVRRFTNDEWMVERYGHAPAVERFIEHYRWIDTMIWREVHACLAAGADVVVDSGFWTRESRDEARRRVRGAGAIPRFYSLNCPLEIMRERTLARSENLPADSLWIDGPAFDSLLIRFEPMGDDEDHEPVDGMPPAGIRG